MKQLRVFGGILVIGAAAIALAAVFGMIGNEEAMHYALMFSGGVAVLFTASVALKTLGGQDNSGTEPPPRL